MVESTKVPLAIGPTDVMKFSFDTTSSSSLWEQLAEVDKVMARRLHPNDTRKITRSLEAFQQHGVPHSELLLAEGNGGERLRFEGRCCCFWVDSDLSVLDLRLDARVDSMVGGGLLDEQRSFREMVASAALPLPLTDLKGMESCIAAYHSRILVCITCISRLSA
jgi:tRNA A37 N6-isopentenylltransferase MiaA